MNAAFAVAAAVSLALVAGAGACAAELRIVEVKAYAFLERAGKLSDDLIGGPPLVDAPSGGAPEGDTATGLLLDFIFAGDKNAAPKYATATVDLTQTGRVGQKIVTHRAFTNFIFGPEGVEHRAVFLDGATCMPLVIEVHAGKTQKSARLDFECGDQAVQRRGLQPSPRPSTSAIE